MTVFLKSGTIALSALLLGAAAPALAADPASARELVVAFLASVDREDGQAANMLAPAAMIAVGDVGGPMTVDMLPMKKARCTLRDVADAPKSMAMRGRDVRQVDTHWICPTADTPGTHEVTIAFFVEGQQIAGAFLS